MKALVKKHWWVFELVLLPHRKTQLKLICLLLDYTSIRIPLEISLQKQCHRKHKPEFSSSGKFHLMQILYSLYLKKFLQFSLALNDT